MYHSQRGLRTGPNVGSVREAHMSSERDRVNCTTFTERKDQVKRRWNEWDAKKSHAPRTLTKVVCRLSLWRSECRSFHSEVNAKEHGKLA